MHRCTILADPAGNMWDFARSVYQNLHKRSKKFELNETHITTFRDHEVKVKIKNNIRGGNCFFIHDSSKPPAQWFLELTLVNEALWNSSAEEVTDVLPYLKFSRQERKDESRVAVSARAIADAIGLYANRVLTIDVHNAAIPSIYRVQFDNLYSSRLLHDHLKRYHPDILKNSVVMSPDLGGSSRARSFARTLGIKDIIIGDKQRVDGKIVGYQIVGEPTKDSVLIVDDIIDSGGTLLEAARVLRAKGIKKVYAYGTHGLFSEGAREKLVRELDRIFVTNSIPQPNRDKLEIVPLNGLFAEAIHRINQGRSLSILFD